MTESGNAHHEDHESDQEDDEHDQWINYLETLYKVVGLVVPVQSNGETHINEVGEKSDVVLDQNEVTGVIAPLSQVESSVAGLHEPCQASNLGNKTIAQRKDHPKITSPPSWVTVAKRTTTNATTTRSATSAKPDKNAETRISTKTEVTGSDFGKLFKKIENIEKRLAEKGYG